MKITHGDEVASFHDAGGVRSGKIGKRILLEGDPSSRGNFKFGIFHQSADFYSPRHRHNFCQFRVQLAGTCDYTLSGKMKPGTIGFFPEGAYYGPQGPDVGETDNATLQFGGPSGQGYVTMEQKAAAKKELDKIGVFEKGVFRRNPDVPGKKNMDGFEAIWEQANGCELVYPEPQYGVPIFMHPENFQWMPLAGVRGVDVKTLGNFTDCRIPCALYRLESGARFTARGRGVFLVMSGAGALQGENYRQFTALYLDTGETATFSADQVSEVLLLGMPNVADLHAPSRIKASGKVAVTA
ncbi:MAG TPA: hypothetical protein VG735_00620 [Caulobacterales bacterium]|nr:hypothetical protein [Caulobacterales bacterium]